MQKRLTFLKYSSLYQFLLRLQQKKTFQDFLKRLLI